MSSFDVRTSTPDEIDVIVFADTHASYSIADRLEKRPRTSVIAIVDEQDDHLYIGSKEDALNLIKALNKAIELNWFDEVK